MEVDQLSAGDPFQHYRQTEGHSILRPTFQSSEQITPAQFDRPTVSAARYGQYLETAPKVPRTPWGVEREYGGAGIMNLPDTFRARIEPPVLMGKGHRHFGFGGYVLPSDVVIDQYYDLTQLKKSQLRATDQLIPSSAELALNQKQIRAPFPTEHPYFSHISKFAVFPDFISASDPHTGTRAGQLLPINPDMPAKSYDVIVAKKIKGFPYRFETQEIPITPKGLAWPGQEGFTQHPKTEKDRKAPIYPTPPKLIAPNKSEPILEHAVSERTAKILKNIDKSHWLSSYKRDFTGSGPMNPLQLDDYHEKAIAQVTGKYTYFSELKEQSHPAFLPNPPLRPMKKKESSKVSTDDAIGYQSPSVPVHEAKSPTPICETDSKPDDEVKICREEKPISWQNRRCQTAISSASCPEYDIRLLRYKVQQMKNSEKPSAFNQHQKERVMDCWATPVINMDQACKITDSENAQPLWKRRKSVQHDISYVDLPQSKLAGFTTKQNQISLSKPPSPNRIEINDPECGREFNFASGDMQPIHTSYASENKEMPQLERCNMLICDNPRLQVSQLKFPYAFNKTEIHKRLHEEVPEKTLDYRDNIYSGRRHTFFGLNSSYFHNGTL
ncbi:sperm-associated microtubule inner protein 4 [Chiloscyllium punctatum]